MPAINLYNKTFLITGGSGYLGQQLTKDILQNYNPQSIRIFSRNEASQSKMKQSFKDDRLRFIIGDVSDYANISKVMRGVDICIHCAAMKRIDTAEANPIECVRVNVKGTINVVESALYHNIECLLYVSTDKAKNPETTYGASKYMGEQIVRNAYHEKSNRRTKFKTVRYGNVIGSTGSVIPIWQEQHRQGLPITVTDKQMTRFFMTVIQASRLVLETIEHGAENTEHSLPMKSVNVYELAKYLYPESEIIITGLKNKEKIHEDLYDGYNSIDHVIDPEIMLNELLKGEQ
jgi:UDP-N-acetylglucosamine 4,6-dehydratase/5-epimerase